MQFTYYRELTLHLHLSGSAAPEAQEDEVTPLKYKSRVYCGELQAVIGCILILITCVYQLSHEKLPSVDNFFHNLNG